MTSSHPAVVHRLSRRLRPTMVRITREVRRHLDLPTSLPRGRDSSAGVWGVAMVRNEADMVELSVRHMLAQGADGVLVADNLSTDGTPARLAAMRAEHPNVHLAVDRLPAYYQAEKMTQLCRAAQRAGARFVVPFDADELWFAIGSTVAEHLRRSRFDVVRAELHNVFPTTDLSTPVDATAPMRLDLHPHPQGKVAFRAHPGVLVRTGNHSVVRPGTIGEGLYVAHVPWRSFDQLRRKTVDGTKAVMASTQQGVARGWQTAAALSPEQARAVWHRIVDGLPSTDISWSPHGPFALAPVLTWGSWPSSVQPDEAVDREG